MNTKKTRIVLLLIAVAAVSLALGWQLWQRRESLPEGLVQANGRIEGDRISIASKVAGRVVQLRVREGDSVRTGQVLLVLDSAEMHAEVRTAARMVAAARARQRAAAAREAQARRDAERLRRLFAAHSIARHDKEAAETAWQVAVDELAAARAAVAAAEARLDKAERVLEDYQIEAPQGGVVTTRIVDQGEVVTPGSPLLELVDLDRLYLKVYVPERLIGKVRLGLPARIYTDAFPDAPFPATVRYIASRAEFTPKEVQTPDERVKLVYAVKLYLEANPDHRLSPGLPADAVIRWREDVPWVKPRW
ncbi:efflux RND transporter periplasmic adaptor subunit [Thiohalobacter sp. IOR34]|uniref:HlyD family secretion protein n=1 Tax=Thiohalobacter sp. IOR34 TaxID=3057176 RepID=UPI0025B22947|nr:efflux RND transporter periplasmic adaptor subunit [Thiohalobacter sp. IOR34]WJW76346.1 efflux RND transporter periplasmic adaptor subunit [Thiohalobacter sp. IOR34]